MTKAGPGQGPAQTPARPHLLLTWAGTQGGVCGDSRWRAGPAGEQARASYGDPAPRWGPPGPTGRRSWDSGPEAGELDPAHLDVACTPCGGLQKRAGIKGGRGGVGGQARPRMWPTPTFSLHQGRYEAALVCRPVGHWVDHEVPTEEVHSWQGQQRWAAWGLQVSPAWGPAAAASGQGIEAHVPERPASGRC